MKNDEISKDKLTIIDPKPSTLDRSTIAVRQKESVTIELEENTVQFQGRLDYIKFPLLFSCQCDIRHIIFANG